MKYVVLVDTFYTRFGRGFSKGSVLSEFQIGDAELIKKLVAEKTIEPEKVAEKPAEKKAAKPAEGEGK